MKESCLIIQMGDDNGTIVQTYPLNSFKNSTIKEIEQKVAKLKEVSKGAFSAKYGFVDTNSIQKIYISKVHRV